MIYFTSRKRKKVKKLKNIKKKSDKIQSIMEKECKKLIIIWLKK